MGRAILVGSLLVLASGCPADSPPSTLLIEIEGAGHVEYTTGDDAPTAQCPSDCDTSQDSDAEATLLTWEMTAVPDPGAAFVHWETDSACLASGQDSTSPNVLTDQGELKCTAVFADCESTDPRDLADDPDGDASLDIRCIAVGINDDNAAYVRVQMEAAWEPPPVYSWYTKVTLRTINSVLGSRTEQRHDGVRETIFTGAVTMDNSSFAINPGVPGYQMTFEAPLPDTIAFIDVETGIQKTDPGNFRMDGPVPADF